MDTKPLAILQFQVTRSFIYAKQQRAWFTYFSTYWKTMDKRSEIFVPKICLMNFQVSRRLSTLKKRNLKYVEVRTRSLYLVVFLFR